MLSRLGLNRRPSASSPLQLAPDRHVVGGLLAAADLAVDAAGDKAVRRLRREQQMIDAQNALRRKRGAKEITEADVQRQAMEDQAMRARGRGPFSEGGGLDDE